MTRKRLSVTPATALAVAALFFALGGSALALGERSERTSAAQQRCTNGAVRGIATVTGDPRVGIANTPDRFTTARALFARRFNCTGKGIQVRRADRGVYEVRFVGIAGASGLGSALGAAVANVQTLPDGTLRVTVVGAGSAAPDDIGFTVVVV